MKTFKKSVLGASLAAALMVVPMAASASVQIQMTGTGAFAGSCDSGLVSATFTSCVLGAMSFDVATNNSPGNASIGGFLDSAFSGIDLLGTGGTVTIWATADDYMFPASGLTNLFSSIGGTHGTVTTSITSAQTWVDSLNVLFAGYGTSGSAFSTGLQGPFIGSGSFGNDTSGAFVVGNPYSITQRLDLTVGKFGQTSGNFNSNVVPEPGSLALIGLGLLAAGALRRRQSQK